MVRLASNSNSEQSPSTFLLGQNARGQWVVHETRGLIEGVFVDRKQAIHFALYECGPRSGAVIETAAPLEMAALR